MVTLPALLSILRTSPSLIGTAAVDAFVSGGFAAGSALICAPGGVASNAPDTATMPRIFFINLLLPVCGDVVEKYEPPPLDHIIEQRSCRAYRRRNVRAEGKRSRTFPSW